MNFLSAADISEKLAKEELNLNKCPIWESLKYIQTMEKRPLRLSIKRAGSFFGKACWQEYYGVDVGKEPHLPEDITEQLLAKCGLDIEGGFGECIGDTHMLVLIPSHIKREGGEFEQLTLESLGELVRKPLQGPASKYAGFYAHGNEKAHAVTSTWVLISKHVLKGSRHKAYNAQVGASEQACESKWKALSSAKVNRGFSGDVYASRENRRKAVY